MVIERSRPFVESTSVPGVRKSLEIQMMAKLVAQGAQECSEGGDFLADGCSHPDADQDRIWVVVAEELDRRTAPDTKRPGGEHADRASPHSVKIRGNGKKLFRKAENLPRLAGLHSRFDRTCDSRQPVICGQQESVQSIAFEEGSKISLPRRSVRLHSQFILHESRGSSNKFETLNGVRVRRNPQTFYWPWIYGCPQFTNILRICRPAMADLEMNKEC